MAEGFGRCAAQADNRAQGVMDMKVDDTVRIKGKDIIGTVIDISRRNGTTYYVVESSVRRAVEGADGGEWPLFDCKAEELETVAGHE